MFNKVNQLLIKAVTPIHAGMGRALGLIDMPIQKEKHTGIPKIEGSTMKGSMREIYRLKKNKEEKDNSKRKVEKLFGSEDGNDSAGLIGFTDAKLLFYPVITLDGIFAYVTCPYLLNRFFQDKALINNNSESLKRFNDLSEGKCVILNKKHEENNDDKKTNIILDEYCFEESTNLSEEYTNLGLENFNLKLEKNVVAISDDDFIEIITLCREVITRNRINTETGVVEKGSLFTEEYLPAESILYTLALQNGIEDKNKLYDNYINQELPKYGQIGGNATIGKGIVEIFKCDNCARKQNVVQGGENSETRN